MIYRNTHLLALRGNLVKLDARRPFIIEIDTTKGNGFNTFTLPLTNHTTDIDVKVSDGQQFNISNYLDINRTINFTTAGVYTIELRGQCGWSFNNTGDCQKLTSITSWGNFYFNYLSGGFYGCINLGLNGGLPIIGSINAPTITSLRDCFRSCKLSFISSGLFDNCPLVTSFYLTFDNNQLTSLPPGLFDSCTNVTNFQQTFYNNLLTSLPVGLFDSCVNVTTFYATFWDNQLTSLPSGLFNCPLVTTFHGTFANNKLTTLPVGLFDSCVNVTTFYETFYNNQLTSLPSGLFNCPLVTTFQGTFQQNQLTSIPSGLFNCPLVTSFYLTFYSNKLTSIPSGLFDSCHLVTTFRGTFYINQLISIPSGLFDNCPLVTSFYLTFYSNKLTSIPSGLFLNNKLVAEFKGTFQLAFASGCIIPTAMFDLTQIYKVTIWDDIFNQLYTNTSPTGYVQDIWNYTSPTATKLNAFLNCTLLTNYDDIPNEWKGL